MWRDLGNERKHSDQLGEQLRKRGSSKTSTARIKTQDILEDQLQSSVATVARLTEELRDAEALTNLAGPEPGREPRRPQIGLQDKYRQEHDAHRATLENMKKLQAKLKQATAKVSRSARRDQALPQTHRTLKATMPTVLYQPSLAKFASETKLSYIRQKTKDKAFGCLQHGYLEPGAEFAHTSKLSPGMSLNSTMKPTESMGEYIARFNVGTSALRWPDTLKIQFMRNRLPVWWRDMTAMKVLESSLTYLDFCQTLRLLEQSNPQRATTTGNRRNQSLEGGGGGGAGGNKSTLTDPGTVLRHLNRCFNCLKKNHTFKATGGYCSKAGRLFDSYPKFRTLLKAIANNGVPVGSQPALRSRAPQLASPPLPNLRKMLGPATVAPGTSRHEATPVQPPAHP
ncbi:hypothetical protein A1F94_010945 [Pyrenophora tritici-repentis]|nr:hypothetical protein A1F94_010945 [Pyrenophora tritici-repentis]